MGWQEYWRSRSFSDLGLRSLIFQNSSLFFSETSGLFETKFHLKAHRRKEMKIYSNTFGHMTKMTAMPMYAKTLQKSSSPEPPARLPWNLVCSIGDSGPSQFVQMMTLGWPWPIFFIPRSNLVTKAFQWGKSEKCGFYFKLSQSVSSKLVDAVM